MKIAIGADHDGREMKEHLKSSLERRGMDVVDVGAHGKARTDYPDHAREAALLVSEGTVNQAVLVCTTGIGMCIAANKIPRVRAALCLTPLMARMARLHNNANVLALGGTLISLEEADAIVEEWLKTKFETGTRHERRVGKISACAPTCVSPLAVYGEDPEIYSALQNEYRRQKEHVELIASENFVSRAVREAQGSLMTNKYAEGYPGKRWYNGCEFVDVAEQLAVERARQLFDAQHVNVQPHSGSQANMAVYFAVLEPGDTLMAMSLAHGGHLTHGHEVNFSGRCYNVLSYGVSQKTEQLDYEEIAELAARHKPKMIVCGASAYSRIIDFRKLRKIADNVGALLMADMAHIAGLVAAGCHPNPVPYCEFVTSTTHKTLRGPRGGMILCQERFAEEIDRQVFPGIQGGPLMHTIAAKAVCLHEALQPGFKQYQQQVVRNAQALAGELDNGGLRIVSGGTDNHLMLVDLTKTGVTGRDAAIALEAAAVTVNKNSIPFDKRSPFVTSGIRLGTPAVTTRGMREPDMKEIAGFVRLALKAVGDGKKLAKLRETVVSFATGFPLP